MCQYFVRLCVLVCVCKIFRQHALCTRRTNVAYRWVTVHKRWNQLIAKHQYCVVPLLEWIEEGLTRLSVPIPNYGNEDGRSTAFFGRSETRIHFKKSDIVPLSTDAAALLSQEGRSKMQAAFSDLIDQAVLEDQSERGLTEQTRARLVDLYTLASSAASYLSVGELLTIIYPAGALHLAARCLVVTWGPTLDVKNSSMVAVVSLTSQPIQHALPACLSMSKQMSAHVPIMCVYL